MKNGAAFVNKLLFYLSPWVLLFGLYKHNFQEFFPYDPSLMGPEFFDFFAVIDGYILIMVVFFVAGIVSGLIKPKLKNVPLEFWIGATLLLIAGTLQLYFQSPIEPILSTPINYFKELIVYPLIFTFIGLTTLDKNSVKPFVYSYLAMVCVFSIGSLFQFFTNYFPGETLDFTGRLVWPFVDFLTLKVSSANWTAFFAVPAVIISFTGIAKAVIKKKFSPKLIFLGITFLLSGVIVYLTQSYGAYAGLFIAFILYLFRSLPLKKFAAAFVILILIGGGMYLVQKNTYKFQLMEGTQETRFDNSVTARGDIMTMNLHIIKTHPWLGVGFNQYQSYFTKNHREVLGKEFNESHYPPHAHNFFLSFWTNMGILGFLGILMLIVGLFWRQKLNPTMPAQFIVAAIMTHGLIDSFYWNREIAYTFWIIILFVFLQSKNTSHQST
jgi:O-antigen ligase